MKKTIVAFGASNSKNSINKQLAVYTAHQITDAEVIALDLNDFEMPIYSIDRETESGIPQLAHDFKEALKKADGIIISFAEHNGAYSVAFKNVFDWVSRIEKDVWNNKPLLLMATSPGGRGGQTVLEIAFNKMKRMTEGGVFQFSLPSFSQNFTPESGIEQPELKQNFGEVLTQFEQAL